jgi:hypothetical protein
MERYFLLRDNQETGPYSVTDLKAKPLLDTDLIWLEGQSTCWNHPEEFEALKNSVTKAPPKEKSKSKSRPQTSAGNSLSYSATYSASTDQPYSTQEQNVSVMDDTSSAPDFETLKKKYEGKGRKKRNWKAQINVGSSIIGLGTLLIGVMVTAYMLKKAVDAIEYEPISATAEAQLISAETLPSSSVSHTALRTETGLLTPENGQAVPVEVPEKTVDSEMAAEAAKKAQKEAALAAQKLNEAAAKEKEKAEASEAKNTQENNEAESGTRNEDRAEPEEPVKKEAPKPDLQIALNNYKVGLLGGVSDLEISVTNPGTQKIVKAVVEVEYLKPNGKVANTQKLEVTGIAPGTTKQLAVPNSSRGVSVRYKIIAIEA